MLFGTNDVKVKPDVLQAKIAAVRKEHEDTGKTMEERAEEEYSEIKQEWDKAKTAQSN
jgi:hypothetical protein